ncbi:hypothetical protein [Methyloversatilis sp.]|uniref:hypothetical protein n=1 Tax=Methyloversatilis sp. TaxID=2569862 RepID=UPI002735F7F9|nr:hypothetical protein [Methyloversatilis sp.]MDP3456731.1 hypothetical protein [Methyloversatilis sp.]MDP3576967.1 hypothetical protein [Methyloversatilis sp.]
MVSGPVFIPDKLPDLRSCARNRWSNGVDVVQAMSPMRLASACSDGGDGCYVLTSRYPQTSVADLWLHHVSGSGQVQASVQIQAALVVSYIGAVVLPAPAGHCIVVFAPTAYGALLQAQRFDALCAPVWAQSVRLLPAAGGFTGLDAISDGAGGVILAVNSASTNNGSGLNVLAQRIDASGALQWGNGGVSVSGPLVPVGRAQIALTVAGNRIGVVWMDSSPYGPSPITGAWMDLSGNVTVGPFTIGIGVDWRHDAAPRRVVADPAGAMYVAFSPDPVTAPVQIMRFEADTDLPAWTRVAVALSHPMAYSIAADGAGGFLLATVEAGGAVSVDRVDSTNISHWRYTAARAFATVPVAALASQPLFNHARLVTVTARDSGGAMVTFEDHNGTTPRMMSWCCNEKGVPATSGAMVAVGSGMGRQSAALALRSANDTTVVVWQEGSGANGTLAGAQKLGCCPPDIPPGRLLVPPLRMPCAIPIDFPLQPFGGKFPLPPFGGLRLLLTCGSRGWRGGVLPLSSLYGAPGIDLPGSFGVRGVPAPDWTRMTFRGLPPDMRIELHTHKRERVAVAELLPDAEGDLLQSLTFAPSAKTSYLLVFLVRRKTVDMIDLPIGVRVEHGPGKPPRFQGPDVGDGKPVRDKVATKKKAANHEKTSKAKAGRKKS